MIYFSIKADRKFLEDYYLSAKWYLSCKNKEFSGGAIKEFHAHAANIGKLREKIAKGLPRAKRLADTFKIPVIAVDFNSKIPHHAFTTILNHDADGLIEDYQKLDLLNETIGACLEAERDQFFKIINPVFWVTSLIAVLLRFPFWVLETAGFKSESFEKSLAGSIVRLIELILIISVLVYFGFSGNELKEVIKKLVNV